MKNAILLVFIATASLFVYGQDSCGSLLPTGLVNGPDSTQTADQDGEFYSLEVNPLNPNTVYIGTEGNGIFKTANGGNTWQWLRQGFHFLPGPNAYADSYDMAINPSDTNEIFVAMNSGPGPLSGNYPSAMGGMYTSNNGGQTWHQRNCGLTNGSEISVFVDPKNPTNIFTAFFGAQPSLNNYPDTFYTGGIYKSTDHAFTWTPSNIPAGADRQGFGKFQWIGDTVTGYCINRRFPLQSLGLIRSTDGGNNWQTFANPLHGKMINDFSVSKDGKTIYVIDRDSAIYATQDAGNTWNKINLPYFYYVSIHPTNSNIVLFSKEGDLYKSRSGIHTSNINDTAYTKVASFPHRIKNIVFAPSDPSIVYVSTRGYRVYKSTDGGNTFTLIGKLRSIMQQANAIEEKSEHAQNMQVIPNPSHGKFSIHINNKVDHTIDLEIYNLLGEKILAIPYFKAQSTNEIDLSESPKGIYFVKWYDGENMYSEKMSIQ